MLFLYTHFSGIFAVRMHQQCAQCGSGSFAEAAFYGSDYHSSLSQTPVRRSNKFMYCDVTPLGSTMISLHQKIDILPSSNGEQKMAIDELKTEMPLWSNSWRLLVRIWRSWRRQVLPLDHVQKWRCLQLCLLVYLYIQTLITAIMSMMLSLVISVYPEIIVIICY